MRLAMKWALSFGTVVASYASMSQYAGAVLVYEGFATAATADANNYAAGGIAGQTPNGSTIGLSTSTAWSGSPYNASLTGLTFGSGATTLATNSGSLTRTNSTGNSVAHVPFDFTPAFTGDLYQSFLVNFGATPNGSALVSAGQTSSSSGDFKRFKVQARDSASGSPIGVQYRTNGNSTGGTTNWISANTTYMFLSLYTNVGTAHTGAGSGIATVYVLTSSQFNYFKAAGLSNIASATVGSDPNMITAKAVDSTSGSGTLNAAQTGFPVGGTSAGTAITLSLQVYGNPTDMGNTIYYDEIRWGTSFDDVTPVVIPEPGSFVLTAGVLAGLGLLWIARKGMRMFG